MKNHEPDFVADSRSPSISMRLHALTATAALLAPHARLPSPAMQLQTAEPRLADFAVSGMPQILSSPAAGSAAAAGKPVLLFLPGIELTGYSLHRQVELLEADFDVRWLAVPANDLTTNFKALGDMVSGAITEELESSNRSTYLVGESFGGVLALSVALRSSDGPPAGLAGVSLINPATSVVRSWPKNLPPLLDAISNLPTPLAGATYQALATPIFSFISGDPLEIGARRSDVSLPAPFRVPAALARLSSQLPEVGALASALPLETLAYRLAMLLEGAKEVEGLKLSALRLPVQVIASTEDRVLPSVDEGKRLVRAMPNARLTQLPSSGHVPLLEARVDLARVLRDAELTSRAPAPKIDYVDDFTPPSAEAFANASARLLNIRKVTSPVFLSTAAGGRRVAGLSGLPPLAEGKPTLFIGNHQLYGFLDLPILVEEVYRQTGSLVRGLAHPVAFRTNRQGDGSDGGGGGGGGFVDFQTFGAVPVGPRALFKLMTRGQPALLYPGGVREAFKSTKQGEMYKLFWPPAEESSDFARVAARFDATIVPVAAIGAEEGFEMVLDADELLGLPFLGERVAEGAKKTPVGRPGERFVSPVSVPTVPGRYYFLFGEPIDTSGVDPTDKEACAALYGQVRAELEASLDYLLEQRKADPYEAFLPRALVEATWNFTRQAPSFKL